MQHRQKAFSLIEILVVLAIIAILIGMTMSVIVSSKKSAYRVRETAQLRQIFLALNLYEGDFDQQSPDSLVTLRTANYLPSQMLANPSDARATLRPVNWPANPWIRQPMFNDPPELINARYSEMNSYSYLKTYSARFKKGRTFAELRNNSEVGLITGLGLMNCENIFDKVGCDYINTNPPVDLAQPPMNLRGPILTIRTDGSVTTRIRKEDGELSYEMLFLFYQLH